MTFGNRKLISSSNVILYADDILLIASSVCKLQRTFDASERELTWLDMAINTNSYRRETALQGAL